MRAVTKMRDRRSRTWNSAVILQFPLNVIERVAQKLAGEGVSLVEVSKTVLLESKEKMWEVVGSTKSM